MLTQDASPKTSTARKTVGRIAARKRSASQWEWPRGRAMAAGRLAQQGGGRGHSWGHVVTDETGNVLTK